MASVVVVFLAFIMKGRARKKEWTSKINQRLSGQENESLRKVESTFSGS